MTATFEYRPALDGVRAFSVIAVIVYHLNAAWMPGGYVGVDVFFVISGYLITSLLVLEHRTHGRIDVLAFWARRARRLLPALALMLVAVAVYYAAFARDLERIGLRGDLLSALCYVANWRFIASGQSYFQQYVSPSPVRHTWSLAIEEQFYLVWPLVMMLVLRRRRLNLLLIGSAAAIASSVIIMVWLYDGSDPSRAYYGSFSRVHQILLGVVLALLLNTGAAGHVRRIGAAILPVSLVVLAALLVFMDDQSSFYYHGGSVLVAVAAMVLIAGLEGGNGIASVAAARPLVAVGLLSYGLYLWHWPVITAINMNHGSTAEAPWAALAVVVTVGLTLASYRFVESPVRRRSSVFGRQFTPRWVLASVPVTTIVVAAVVVPLTATAPAPVWATTQGAKVLTDSHAAGDNLSTDVEADALRIGLVGDSVMVSLAGGLAEAAKASGYELFDASLAACPVGYSPLYDDQGVKSPYFEDRCRPQVRPAHDALLEQRPDLVIWHDLQSVLSRRSDSGELLLSGTAPWTSDLLVEWTGVIDRFLEAGADVVIVMPMLRSQDPPGACTQSVNADRCAEIQSQDSTARSATQAFVDGLAGRPGVTLIELDDLVCPNGYPCPTTVDGVMLRIDGWDQTHFTEEGARWIDSRLLERVLTSASRD